MIEKTYDTRWAVDPSAMVTETIKVFLDRQVRLDSELFGTDQVAFARGVDAKHVNYRSWKRETKRNVVADLLPAEAIHRRQINGNNFGYSLSRLRAEFLSSPIENSNRDAKSSFKVV